MIFAVSHVDDGEQAVIDCLNDRHDRLAVDRSWRTPLRRDAAARTVPEAPDARLVPDLVAELVTWATEAEDRPPMPVRAALAHLNSLTGRMLRNSTYRQVRPDVSYNLASRDLNELVKADLLEPIGEKRGRRYVPSVALRELAGRVRVEVHRGLPISGDPYEQVGQ